MYCYGDLESPTAPLDLTLSNLSMFYSIQVIFTLTLFSFIKYCELKEFLSQELLYQTSSIRPVIGSHIVVQSSIPKARHCGQCDDL